MRKSDCLPFFSKLTFLISEKSYNQLLNLNKLAQRLLIEKTLSLTKKCQTAFKNRVTLVFDNG